MRSYPTLKPMMKAIESRMKKILKSFNQLIQSLLTYMEMNGNLEDEYSGLFHSKNVFESIKPKSTFALSLSHIVKEVRAIEIDRKIASHYPSIN